MRPALEQRDVSVEAEAVCSNIICCLWGSLTGLYRGGRVGARSCAGERLGRPGAARG